MHLCTWIYFLHWNHNTLEYNTLIILPVNILGGIDKTLWAWHSGQLYTSMNGSAQTIAMSISLIDCRKMFYAMFAKNHKNSKKSILNASSCYIGFWLVLFLLPLMFKNKSSKLKKSSKLLPSGSAQRYKQFIASHSNIYISPLLAPGAGSMWRA